LVEGVKGAMRTRTKRGFSLIELLIVVAIILIIAAIAIPNLLRARIAANESSAASSVRTTNTAQIGYQSTYPTVGYAPTMLSLGPPAITGCSGILPTAASACLIDWVLAKATTAATPKSGYFFLDTPFATGGINLSYVIGGAPAAPNQTGVRGFCSTEEGVIRYQPGPVAAPVATIAACVAYTALQ
jgi:type IV pilus assembly protein PilA